MSLNEQDRQDHLDALLGRALRDKEFRERLIADPGSAAEEAGLTAEELELVSGGLAIGSSLHTHNRTMYCSEKACNEKTV